jgi:hypothetical protein
MAMEINSKRLHKHALPVVMLLVGLTIISAIAFGNTNNNAVGRGLVTRVIHVKLYGTGLAKITLAAPQPRTEPNFNHVGQTAADRLSAK